MDAIAGLSEPSADFAASPAQRAVSTGDGPQSEVDEAPATPLLVLDGFSGPLDHLLTLARAQTIDLATLSLTALVDQLSLALRQAPAATSLAQKGDWVVMAAWLVQLRTRLLLPADAPAQQEAQAEANALRMRLVARQGTRALADWLARRPQLGHDVFARGRPEVFGVTSDPTQAVDGVEFLWGSLALFDDDAVPDTTPVYRPLPLELYAVAEARDRIRQRLAEAPAGRSLDQLLPDGLDPAGDPSRTTLRRRSAWTSTFIANLELAKQGDVALQQSGDFQAIYLSGTSVEHPSSP